MGPPLDDAQVRALALSALEQVLGEGRQADRVLERTLRANRGLTSRQRASLARRVLGVACFRERLRHLLGALGTGATGPAWMLAAYLIDQEGTPPSSAAREAGVPEAEAARLLAPRPWPAAPLDRLCAERSLPRWLAELWLEQLGFEEADRLAASMNLPGPITARANLLRNGRQELVEALAREGIDARPASLSPDGVHLQGRPNVFGSRAWREGRFEIQDEGSQLIARLCAPRPGERCVDFCAGAGGKTLALAALMGNRGEIVALDVDRQRLADQRPRLERAGVECVRSQAIEPSGPLPREAFETDLVLVDAPCSSLGTLRRGPDARWRMTRERVDAFPALQLEILERAAQLVRPGGRLVYATCTLNSRENQEVASRFERKYAQYRRVPLTEPLGAELAARLGGKDELWLAPHLHGTDGFFAVHWRREAPPA